MTSPIPALSELRHLRLLLLVTSVNSFTQRLLAHLADLSFEHVSVQLASSDEDMLAACEKWDADMVLCPFLTKRVPASIFTRWITLVVHPGPPGDAGPSSLDWTLMGDDGYLPSAPDALHHLLSGAATTQRSHWGTIVFQANEHLDGGAVWAWEQYPLPPLGTITKAQVYQTLHSTAALQAVCTALERVCSKTRGVPREAWVNVRPEQAWQEQSVANGQAFLGGKTHDRPLLQAKQRRPDWTRHTAADVLRILNASDSQPGAQLAPLTTDSKTCLFAYGGHVHLDPATLPAQLWEARGWSTFGDVPERTVLATRDGAVLVKTRQGEGAGAGAGIWITHGRVPKKAGSPLEPKVPMVEAIRAGGHGSVLEGVQKWEQDGWEAVEGEWQEVRVKEVANESNRSKAMLIYWDFYNGACSTRQCQMLLRALQWATEPSRGDVTLLCLMGGTYFSNGVALNTIEAASSPPHETWANINAIDDIVEFLLGDPAPARSAHFKGRKSLTERGITTMACLKGNAAAGGVALAAACDVVVARDGVVLNPAYRAMGLHGSEFHSYSYVQRCGPRAAASLLVDMLPLSPTSAQSLGLIDLILPSSASPATYDQPFLSLIAELLSAPSASPVACAPWSRPTPSPSALLLPAMAAAKRRHLTTHRFLPPLVHFRNEELGQMLLDSFHPVRSKRYHERRYKFIRKVKNDATPSRYAKHLGGGDQVDEEGTPAFDAAPGWRRGEEWGWVGMDVPEGYGQSEKLRVDLFPDLAASSPAPATQELPQPATPPKVAVALPLPVTPAGLLAERKHSSSSNSTLGNAQSSLPTTPSGAKLFTSVFSSEDLGTSSSSTTTTATSTPPKTEGPSPKSSPAKMELSADDLVSVSLSPKRAEKTKSPKGLRSFGRRISAIVNGDSKDKKDKKEVQPQQQQQHQARRKSFVVTSTTAGNVQVYQRPQVEGADKVEFPCLYDPHAVGVSTENRS